MPIIIDHSTPATIECLNLAYKAKLNYFNENWIEWQENAYPNIHFELTREIRIVEPSE